MHRFPTPSDVAEPAALAAVLGPVRAVQREPLASVGFTQARFERLDVTLGSGEHRRLVTKRLRPSTDWTALRTGDHCGRGALMLGEPRLAGIWDVIACPYLGYAADAGEVVLVMDDLSPYLLPDVREPLLEEQEERLVSALARLHARFWESPALELPWLARPEHFVGLFDPCCAADPEASAVFTETLREQATRGWAIALRRLPPRLHDLMRAPARELEWLWDGLPRTLLHGDAKVANFALLPDGRVSAFDWALLAAGPAANDIGWYVAVNATRLVGSKEDTIRRYRSRLEAELGRALTEPCWARFERAAIMVGARMLMWSKALALESGRAGADREWAWWVERLQAVQP